MRRRDFIVAIGTMTAWPLAIRAQQTAMPVVGVLYSAPMKMLRDETSVFRKGLAEIGYMEGRNVAFEYRTAEGEPERLAAVATELARVPVDVIAAYGTAPANAAKSATTSFPIVAISEPRAPRRQCHRQYRPGSRHWRQTDTAHQRGHPNRLAGGFSLESR